MPNGAKVIESHEAYNAHPALRASYLKMVLEAPKIYEWFVVKKMPRKITPALEFGDLAHKALLEPAHFKKHMIMEPKFSGTGMKAAKQSWYDALPHGAIVVDDKDAEVLTGMMGSLVDDPDIQKLLSKGYPELSLYWDDAKTGRRCKARPDYITEDGWIINFKTAADASLRGFHYAIQDQGYHLQAVSYTTGYREVFGKEPQGYIWVVVEKTAPWLTAIYVADQALMEVGEKDYRTAIDLVDACTKSGVWPSYQFDRRTGLRTGPQNICVPYNMLVQVEA